MSDRDEFYRQFSQSYDKLHQSERQDDLVERVARAMWEAVGADPHDFWADDFRAYECQARAAIAVALEEAAKVADNHGLCEDGNPDCQGCGEEIAAAIRAMIPKENT